ncbi:MAG: hypothetical protein VR72_04150 [Clostridiaceae bacterium BRH_c20a]|nr:MAG: hypothetical protein VR72_04150 [Clostridiaceae bacterium BRH_c20a]
MSGMAKKKSQRKIFIVLLSLTLLFSLSILGISFSDWSDRISFVPTIKTGELKADISIVSGPATVVGNTINFTAALAGPGDTFTVVYNVKNSGFIPIKVRAVETLDADGILTTIEPVVWQTLGLTESNDYIMIVEMPAAATFKYSDTYTFAAKIEIEQWNI